MQIIEKTKFETYLELDGSIALKIAIYNRFNQIGDSCYAEICGGFIDGVYQWADHNIYDINESYNKKYTGYTITFSNNSTKRVYIENWVLNIEPKDWKHAKSLFDKYLKKDTKYNESEISQGF